MSDNAPPPANYLTVNLPERELWTCINWDTSGSTEVELAICNDGQDVVEIQYDAGETARICPLPPGQWIVVRVPDEAREFLVLVRAMQGATRVQIGAIAYQRRPGPSRYPAETLADHSWFPYPKCS